MMIKFTSHKCKNINLLVVSPSRIIIRGCRTTSGFAKVKLIANCLKNIEKGFNGVPIGGHINKMSKFTAKPSSMEGHEKIEFQGKKYYLPKNSKELLDIKNNIKLAISTLYTAQLEGQREEVSNLLESELTKDPLGKIIIHNFHNHINLGTYIFSKEDHVLGIRKTPVKLSGIKGENAKFSDKVYYGKYDISNCINRLQEYIVSSCDIIKGIANSNYPGSKMEESFFVTFYKKGGVDVKVLPLDICQENKGGKKTLSDINGNINPLTPDHIYFRILVPRNIKERSLLKKKGGEEEISKPKKITIQILGAGDYTQSGEKMVFSQDAPKVTENDLINYITTLVDKADKYQIPLYTYISEDVATEITIILPPNLNNGVVEKFKEKRNEILEKIGVSNGESKNIKIRLFDPKNNKYINDNFLNGENLHQKILSKIEDHYQSGIKISDNVIDSIKKGEINTHFSSSTPNAWEKNVGKYDLKSGKYYSPEDLRRAEEEEARILNKFGKYIKSPFDNNNEG